MKNETCKHEVLEIGPGSEGGLTCSKCRKRLKLEPIADGGLVEVGDMGEITRLPSADDLWHEWANRFYIPKEMAEELRMARERVEAEPGESLWRTTFVIHNKYRREDQEVGYCMKCDGNTGTLMKYRPQPIEHRIITCTRCGYSWTAPCADSPWWKEHGYGS